MKSVLDPKRESPRVIYPEVVREHDPQIKKLGEWMDSLFRVGPVSFGLDGILGLIPGIGDALTGFISAYIVYRASRAGIPKSAVARMMTNVAIDALLGAVPFVGDVFDFFYKANTRNLKIYEDALAGKRSNRADWAFVVFAIAGILAIVTIPLLFAGWLLAKLL